MYLCFCKPQIIRNMERVYCFGVLKRLLMTVAVCMLAATAVAYDFSSTHKGKELYYDITSATTVKVTYPSYGSDYASGDVVIPTEVANNGTTYRVTSVGNNAFRTCSSLTSIAIPGSVVSIGEYAFHKCVKLQSVVLESGLVSIQYGAFDGCSGLTAISIPSTVTTIGNSAFSYCSSLTSVVIPDGVETIGNGAFSHCSLLTSVVIPAGVETIDNNAFRDCGSLTSVVIPNSVTTIGNNAFRACSSLAEITIGSSVATIGDYAFYDCNNLTSAVSLAATPPLVKYEAFPQSDKCSLRVPCGSLKAYTAEGSYWNKAFSQRIAEDCKKQLR